MAEEKIAFVREHLPVGCKDVLDLGAGDGIIASQLASSGMDVTAVDYAGRCAQVPGVVYLIEDVRNLKLGSSYDAALMIGLAIFLDDDDLVKVYRMCHESVRGPLLLEHQCALERRKEVEAWSSDLGALYCSVYRTIEEELALLLRAGWVGKAFFPFAGGKFDVWKDTQHVAFVCRRMP
jgi:SAM-dependent methyltransferase